MKKTQVENLNKRAKNGILSKHWKKISVKPHHGINIPLFSIHSTKSCGIGEFLDLKLLIDFCKSVSMNVIQLLPLNDTGYESSPYNAVSSQALNPIYISLHDLPFVSSDSELKLELSRFKRYTFLQKVAYNAVLTAKVEFLRLYYNKYFDNFKKSLVFEAFTKENPWLNDYGLFKSLKDNYSHKGWFSWEKRHQNLSRGYRKTLLKEKKKEIDFYIFLQFLCTTQLEEVKSYADKKGVLIKGDIPILISPESLDVWQGRENFDLTFSAGAPPDRFSADGQNWGFPIYNWSHIEKTDYLFWSDRLKTASRFYHIYRIDHIIGLYRIFAIERGQHALSGSFIPDDPSLALMQGEEILKKLTTFTYMLPIGEDLGEDIEYIRESLSNQTIPGTKIPRWERNYRGDGKYIQYKDYDPFSLTTVSTHDSETLTLWWKDYPEEAKEFAEAHGMEYSPHLTKDLRYQMLKDSHASGSLFHINLLSEYLELFEDLSWPNPSDERINLPGTILPSNWCYRLRPSLEQLLSHHDLREAICGALPHTPQKGLHPFENQS
jgi:4-alpha-glucanotransferase